MFTFVYFLWNRAKKDADRVPSLFEIILDPEGDLQEKKEEPTLFDIVLRPEKFITTSAEEREAEEYPEYENPNDFNQFRYEFSTTASTTTTTITTTSEQRCLKRGHVANYKLFIPSLSFITVCYFLNIDSVSNSLK